MLKNGFYTLAEKLKEEQDYVDEDEEENPKFVERVLRENTAVVIEKQNISKCTVKLWGNSLDLELTFPQDEIQPLFSGAAWAGTVLWPASVLLCELLKGNMDSVVDSKRARPKPQIAGNKVIELGCGLGVPGLAAHLLGASQVFLTEQDPLPELILRNVDRTFPDRDQEALQVHTLDWSCEDDLKEFAGKHLDYILVSDCIYQELYGDSWRYLADCIKALSIPGVTTTYQSFERRKKDGINDFLDYCKEIGVQFNLIYNQPGPLNELLEVYEMWV